MAMRWFDLWRHSTCQTKRICYLGLLDCFMPPYKTVIKSSFITLRNIDTLLCIINSIAVLEFDDIVNCWNLLAWQIVIYNGKWVVYIINDHANTDDNMGYIYNFYCFSTTNLMCSRLKHLSDLIVLTITTYVLFFIDSTC